MSSAMLLDRHSADSSSESKFLRVMTAEGRRKLAIDADRRAGPCPQVLGLLNRHFEQQATIAAYQDCFMLAVMICLVSMPIVLLVRVRRPEVSEG
jgi:hypothetical protein